MLGFAPLADNSIAGFGNVPVDVVVTGVAGTGGCWNCCSWRSSFGCGTVCGTASVGSVTVEGDANANVTGLSATGSVGSVFCLGWGKSHPRKIQTSLL